MHLRPMLSVRDLAKSLDFYRAQLGFELVEQLGEPGHLFWAYVKKGQAELMLTQGSGPSADPEPASEGDAPNAGIWLYVYPESLLELERLHADLAARGQSVSDLEDTEYGHRVFAVRDPDGYVLTFGLPAAEDPA